MKLLGSAKKDVDQDKDSESVPKSEYIEVVLVHCNLLKSDYQHTSKVLFMFVPNKQCRQLINVSSHSLMMKNTVDAGFIFVLLKEFFKKLQKLLEI